MNAAQVDATYAFSYALQDLLDVISVDLLPPPINIGWRHEHGDQLVVQVAGVDAQPWVAALDIVDGTSQLHASTPLIVQVTGRLPGKSTQVVLYYDRMPTKPAPIHVGATSMMRP